MAYPRIARELARPWRAGLTGLRRGLAMARERIPSDCPLCAGPSGGASLCPPCRDDVVRSMRGPAPRCAVCRLALGPHPACPDCARRPPAFQKVVAAFDYAAPGDLLVSQFKAGRRFSHARFLARLLADAVHREAPGLPAETVLVPVPASRASIVQRGFNPAAELARCLAPALALPCRPGLLVRRQEGARQANLGREQRLSPTPQRYRCTARIEGASIAVVDDVLTTGGTLHGIAERLREAGAARVWGLVLARTPYPAGQTDLGDEAG